MNRGRNEPKYGDRLNPGLVVANRRIKDGTAEIESPGSGIERLEKGGLEVPKTLGQISSVAASRLLTLAADGNRHRWNEMATGESPRIAGRSPARRDATFAA